ncbi:MAG: epoxyqueuosine reductase [bacterium]
MSEIFKNPVRFLQEKIEKFTENNPQNRLNHLDKTKIFQKPLIGWTGGNNPLFTRYKNIIGEFHLTPEELINQEYNEKEKINKEDLSVICWVLPISEKTRMSNRKEKRLPSLRWAHTRTCGEQFNDSLRKYVESILKEQGYRAVAPMLSDSFEWKDDTTVGIASTWSERHALYAAGMGTFGLCDGFITEAGKAMRCGSVITDLKLPASISSYKDHTDNCLFLSGNDDCKECSKRCPAGAITEFGHDKDKCLDYQRKYIKPEEYGVEVPGCGLCQTGVPCESEIPG